MRIGICDDNEQARRIVFDWLVSRPDFVERSIYEFSCGAALLEHLRRFALDLIFLDCKMECMDGIETAREIRKTNTKVVIILLTEFTDYAVFGYSADVLDYIQKKNFQSQAPRAFGRAVKRIQENAVKTYAVRTGTGLFHLEIMEILYIESRGRKKELLTVCGKKHEFYGRINDVEKDLRKHGFIRPHNSYLVNSVYIKILMPNNIWLSGLDLPLPVSRGKYKQVYDDMTIYATEARL